MRSVLFFLTFALSLIARTSVEDLRADLDQLVNAVEKNVHVGIKIASVKTGEVLYEKNSCRLFVPASNLKLFTGAAALTILGVDYRFETAVLRDEDGNLYLKGSGDPEFSRSDINELALALKMQGIEEIPGAIIVDNLAFDALALGPGWMWDEPAEFWNSPMDALTVDHSSVRLLIAAAKAPKQAPRIYLDTPIEGFSIENLAVTGEKDTLRVERLPLPDDHCMQVLGIIPIKAPIAEIKVPLAQPAFYAGKLLLNALKQHGVKVEGDIRRGAAPQGAAVLASHASRPLSQIVAHMMKESDNLYADTLFKKIGQICFGLPGTWQKGSQAVREFLKREAAVDSSQMVLLDGSGLSRYNLVSPHQFVQFLIWAQSDFRIASEFMASLAIGGIDGTLKKRMALAAGKVRAKTGGMTGVSGISGYVKTKEGEILAFSILINGFVRPAAEYRNGLEDRICDRLSRFKRG